jgi:glucose 1-dehydrogenase
MLAIGMLRGQTGVHALDIPKPQIKQPDDVLIRMKEVGLDGTDFGIVQNNAPDFAEDRSELVLAHEGVGIVEDIGSSVTSLVPGDIVVMTVRRGCGQCEPCANNHSDMCLTGLFTERGIHQIDGLLTQFVIDKEQYVVKVPPEAARLAVLTEPLSVTVKGLQEMRNIQSRVPWFCSHSEHGWLSKDWGGCKVALVVGAGPLGLLATSLLRLAQTYTYVADILPEEHIKARTVAAMGAEYIDVRNKTPEELVNFCCTPKGLLHIIFEASGAAEEAIRLIPFMSRSSIYVMTGIPRGDLEIQLDAAKLVRGLVRKNQVVFGSVNSNRQHFELALKDIVEINKEFNGVLENILSHRVRLDKYEDAFASRGKYIKTVIEIEPW